ncbi:MAG: ThuA domain-containing protein [Bryobacterales bacterium]|nr:ThuA domain-containing protein [Bryobacterales bacterium]
MRILISLLAIAAFASEPSYFFAPGKVRVLMLSGRNNHDWRSTTPFLARLLESTGRFDVRITEEPTALNPAALEPYQVLVSDYNGPRWSPAAEQAVEAFLRSGKGLVATHAATYAFGDMEILGDRHFRTGIHEPPWPAYARIIGARWSDKDPKSGHGKRHLFRVQITDRTHPITEGLEPTFPISDELYHNLRLSPGVHVLATAFDAPGQNGTGRNEPIAWTILRRRPRLLHRPRPRHRRPLGPWLYRHVHARRPLGRRSRARPHNACRTSRPRHPRHRRP